ncbi:rho GTPase-activating protein 44-like [Actinia tenebrosa]|uniref:Rho GTPase-activating protein 44-like n=1 Tax=Actinia tenebrosa TaxID=6105 RepID=A0A6P8I170_ACTTE|nr:rho GTPase-activating protein 44-like [Actinia tenebrosa]
MKKQFYRVKQLADQRVGRAEKTEILSEDLQNVEKTVEKIKHACQSANKRITASMQGSGSDFEKRMKKLNQTGLANSMLESSNQLGDSSVLGTIMSGAGEAELAVAKELCEFEMAVERNVIAPMTTLLENDIPSIAQSKKKLSKAALDMDTCKSRWMAAVKGAHGASKDMWAAASKADSLKDELEEETAKFEGCQDSFTTEALKFVSREGEYADWIIHFMQAQLEYHRKAAVILENALPDLKIKVDESSLRPVFGCPLEEHLKAQNRSIAFVLEESLTFLHETALEEQGLFRLAGSASKIRKLKAEFDAGLVDLAEYSIDLHAITGVVKLYLRELPEPLMTFKLYDEWIQAASIQENGAKLQAYWTLVEKLPKPNKDNLRYLICFLAKLCEHAEFNKMTASNVAIVIGPNIIYSQLKHDGVSLQHTGIQSSIIEALIQHHKYFFPKGVDFFRSIPTQENGLNTTTNSSSNSSSNKANQEQQRHSTQQKRSVAEFQSVTGGLLEEVVGMINASSSSDNDLAGHDPVDSQAKPPTPVKATSIHHGSISGGSAPVKKRQAPTPASAQVKYLGSTSPVSTSPPLPLAKPTGLPPPPPSKPTGAPPPAPKPGNNKN